MTEENKEEQAPAAEAPKAPAAEAPKAPAAEAPKAPAQSKKEKKVEPTGFEVNLKDPQTVTVEGRTFTIPAGPTVVSAGEYEALKNSGLL